MGKRKIVVVDDEEFVRMSVFRNLEAEFDSDIVLALEPKGSARHTALLIIDEGPDVIVMDLGFNHLSFDGGDVIRALRENGFAGEIILFSGFIPEDKKTSLEACEVLAYIQKPNLNVLKETLKTALRLG
ncbi:hypothetical protein A3K24_03280 [candidate division Kazan bacterium RIFCSPHIGHO2_01_FULL_44_14]|uniref:Response regulatory domain-containing protein n=1 Tax=candidate division Kazan bacterium RIFCSPLOWO2_01_FULL_45_19 TaxID=1798538 RepID=A0A1F4NR29_UNCK3|nr:hypothetical protein [uncultured bacterium]OGB73816.1 MAG: hypothetical protein A3K51_03280 [candidate division Kazan bacterium RIFCSPLOWO2_01_FULL_45_19]OGB78061.1 MAG: hypothetical protein A3K24_03280 [candidate division Kazan bacterium RIFCSPHIGHO2_01_FULL_44_14]